MRTNLFEFLSNVRARSGSKRLLGRAAKEIRGKLVENRLTPDPEVGLEEFIKAFISIVPELVKRGVPRLKLAWYDGLGEELNRALQKSPHIGGSDTLEGADGLRCIAAAAIEEELLEATVIYLRGERPH